MVRIPSVVVPSFTRYGANENLDAGINDIAINNLTNVQFEGHDRKNANVRP